MSKKYYVENLSIETLAELTDEMIRFRKNTKTKKLNLNLLKIIPAAAAIVFVIGLITILPVFINGPAAGGVVIDGTNIMINSENVMRHFEYLKEKNPDIYGWIKVSGTAIDYPVVQTDDNEFYLSNGFDKTYERSGSIFADFRNDRDIMNNRNIIIYGHNMFDGTKFQPLIKYGEDEELFNSGIIELITEKAVYRYEVFSVREEELTYPYIETGFGPGYRYATFADFAYDMKSRSHFKKEGIIFNEDSQIITLATCTNKIKGKLPRFIVQGVLVDIIIITDIDNIFENTNPSTITIKGVEYSTELTELALDSNQLTDADIEPLRYMVNLTKLSLDGNQISDISPLTELTNLTELSLFGNQISDISPLAGLKNLAWLSLTGNPVSDISALAGLTNLTRLYLLGNQISDINPLAELTNLIQLDLWGSQISDLSPLANLTNLTFLGLSNTQISDISVLAGLTNLQSVRLNGTQISDLSPLADLPNLLQLCLDNAQINDINPLAELPRLCLYYFDRNPISDISILAELTSLRELCLVDPLLSSLSSEQIEEIKETFKKALPNITIMP